MDHFDRRMNRSGRFSVYRPNTKDRLASIPFYVCQMLDSEAKHRTFSIFCWQHPDCHLVSLICPKGIPHLMIFVKLVHVAREQTIRSFFTQAGIAPIQDELIGQDGSRFLNYPLPAMAEKASNLLQELLRRAYEINDDMELEIMYSEKDRA